MTTRAERSVTPAERSPASRVRRTTAGGPVRVWAEVSVTVAITDQPPQFVKFTTGHERIAPDDSETTIKRTEKAIYDLCEQICERRVKSLARLVEQQVS